MEAASGIANVVAIAFVARRGGSLSVLPLRFFHNATLRGVVCADATSRPRFPKVLPIRGIVRQPDHLCPDAVRHVHPSTPRAMYPWLARVRDFLPLWTVRVR